jgi:hypothetical protein
MTFSESWKFIWQPKVSMKKVLGWVLTPNPWKYRLQYNENRRTEARENRKTTEEPKIGRTEEQNNVRTKE